MTHKKDPWSLVQVHDITGKRDLIAQAGFPSKHWKGISEWTAELRAEGLLKADRKYEWVNCESPHFFWCKATHEDCRHYKLECKKKGQVVAWDDPACKDFEEKDFSSAGRQSGSLPQAHGDRKKPL